MSVTVLTKPKHKSKAEYEAIATQLLVEINRLEELMDRDEAESERLKAERQVIKARSEVTLAQLREQMNRLKRAG